MRKAAAVILAVILAVAAAAPIAAQEDDTGGLGPPALYEELREAAPEPAGRIAPGARLQVDRFEFSFDGGDLYVVPPIGGRNTIAVYLGRGTLRAHPPDGVELQQFQKLIDADTIDEPFDRFVVWFTGDLGARLRALADPGAPGRHLAELLAISAQTHYALSPLRLSTVLIRPWPWLERRSSYEHTEDMDAHILR